MLVLLRVEGEPVDVVVRLGHDLQFSVALGNTVAEQGLFFVAKPVFVLFVTFVVRIPI